MRLQPGDRVGPLVVETRIGQGGAGAVWRASHDRLPDPVAVKFLHHTRRDELVDEVAALAALRSPHVVWVHDADTRGAPPWIALELAVGTLASRPPTSWPDVSSALTSLLRGLAHVHAAGLVHRDVKPSNLLDLGRRWALADFGIAIRSGESGRQAGTRAYMAPEQIRGHHRDYGPWTDLYAVGCIAWQLSTGTLPFGGDLQAHLIADPPPFRPRLDVPPGLRGWIGRLIAKSWRARPTSAADALGALQDLGLAEAAPVAGEQLASLPTLETAAIAHEPIELASAPVDTLSPRVAFAHWTEAPRLARTVLPHAAAGLFSLRTPRLVGRRSEQDALWEALADVFSSGRARAVVLSGPSGVGTTRLARWCARSADELGIAQAWETRCGIDAILGTVRTVLGGHGLPADALVERAALWCPSEPVARAFALAGCAEGTQSGDVRLSGPRERNLAIRQWIATTCNQRPLVWVLDDAPANEDAMGLVRSLLSEGEPCPVLLLLTSSEPSEGIAELDHLDNVDHLALGPLDDPASLALVRDLVGLGDELVERVRQRSGGNPSFAAQIVSSWIDQDALQPGPDGFCLARPDTPLPIDGLDVWSSRVARFLADRDARDDDALQLAAVLGQHVDEERWRRAGAEPTPDLVDDLIEVGLATRLPGRTGWSFSQSQALAALELRAGAGLATLHRRAAQAWEDHPEERGRHLFAAGAWSEALEPLAEAIRRASRATRVSTCQTLLGMWAHAADRAEVSPDDVRRADPLYYSALMARRTGRLEHAAELAEQLVARARLPGWESTLPRALQAIGAQRLEEGDFEGSLGPLEEALALYAPSQRQWGYVQTNLAIAEQRLGRDIAHRLHRARDCFEALDDPEGVGDCLYYEAVLVVLEGPDPSEMAALLDRAEAAYRRAGSRWGAADVASARAQMHQALDQLEPAAQACRQAIRRYRQLGVGQAWTTSMRLAFVLLRMRRADEAEPVLEALVARYRGGWRHPWIGSALIGRALCFAAAGRVEPARSYLDEAVPLVRDRGLYDPWLAEALRTTRAEWPELAGAVDELLG